MAVTPGQPGRRAAGDDLAPVFRLEVNDLPVNVDINRFVVSLEYESALDMADMARVIVDNPGLVDGMTPDWTTHKAFQHGNEVSVFIGYGRADRPENFVGRAIWARHLPSFAREATPRLELKGYDRSIKLMDVSGKITGGSTPQLETKRPVDSADDQGQVFSGVLHSEVVAFIADQHGLEKDIDATTRQESVVVKKGMKHFELVKGLANLNNRDFWVDYNAARRKWVLHWKEPNRNQAALYVFRYNDGDASTLFEAEPDYGLREQVTTATVSIFDGKNQRWVSAIEIEEAAGPDPIFRQGSGLQARSTATSSSRKRVKKKRPKKEARSTTGDRNVIKEALENAATFRIAAGGVAIDVLPPGDRFRSPEDAARYLLRWFRSRQENFVTVSGVTLGIETLRARQVHTLRGLGERLSGDYFFTRVRHILDESGYRCEFVGNKVIES